MSQLAIVSKPGAALKIYSALSLKGSYMQIYCPTLLKYILHNRVYSTENLSSTELV